MSLATKKLAKKYGAKIDADTGQDIDLFAKTRMISRRLLWPRLIPFNPFRLEKGKESNEAPA